MLKRLVIMALAAVALSGLANKAWAAEAKTAIFAGGCFWCVESDFDRVPGVLETVSGYTGGTLDNPTYKQVSAGGTGHYEAVRVTYDPEKVSYEKLLTAFWHSVDPTDAGGQFCDRGDSYRTAVFYQGEAQHEAAEASKQAAEAELGKEIVTRIVEAGPFYPAEDYHQGYYKTHSLQYKYYRWACGRDARIEELWGDRAHLGLAAHE